ncbi:pyruvate, water dikinase regulatory protein [Salinicoccus roseus]|jgi:regulator of PEP synthase PpsR (kinase-PPPase family)|uniref:Putative pyruvate, phosphate dikinase regulatory protein n=2 Tax=Salinicoccus roseus TaxID=45670 RepID=A0A265E9M9_9STAP|nr:pyruvate, water dikinase regulatory protein [Salinicoccus roseus]MCG7332813.1 kinase/pyrophosphorylase [Salinicoccus roseus]OZT78136.1 phosphoenolpyruvate synthase regulatory protein [Salinicoccus roseus]
MSKIKVIVASDSVGETGELVAKACLSQFNVDESDEVLIRYPYIESEENVDDVIDLARSKNAIVVFTIITPELRKYIKQELQTENIASVDIMGPLMSILEGKAEEAPYYEPGRVHRLDEDYFKKIEAIEFAVKYDDGKDASGLDKADIVLIGVSRTSKTPLSQYLAHKKYKVMNVPMVPEVTPPKELYNVDPHKCVGLKINPTSLNKIRKERLAQLGLKDTASYANDQRIQEELDYFNEVIGKIGCPVIDVSEKAIEETANEILDYVEGRPDIKG